MNLYHFTKPENLFHIALDGLQPFVQPSQAFMTGGIPVVWLTRGDNVATADDVIFFASEGAVIKEGGFIYGGAARLQVNLPRHDKRLVRYLEFCRSTGCEVSEIQKLLGRRGAEWWVYLGAIPARKINLKVPPLVALQCLDHHISTHPDFSARATFSKMREEILQITDGRMIEFGVSPREGRLAAVIAERGAKGGRYDATP